MKLALYLPNFRDKVTVKELEDLTALAEELDFDSVWTLDRIVVPEASDRGELQYSFGMMDEFPPQLPVSSRGEWYQGWPLIPWLAAKTQKVRIGMSITDTPYRAPGVLAAELATVDHLSNGRLNVGVGAGWMPEEFAAASASHIFPKRHQHVRETIEIMQGIWTNDLFEYHGEFADFDRCGFGAKPVQQPRPPLIIGGTGRRRTPALAARHADEFNLPFESPAFSVKQFGRVRDACSAVGRSSPMRFSNAVILCCGKDDAEVAPAPTAPASA